MRADESERFHIRTGQRSPIIDRLILLGKHGGGGGVTQNLSACRHLAGCGRG